jgi:hypothetical protein
MIKVTRYPFWFWQMKSENVEIKENRIIKDGKKYNVKEAPKYFFLAAKYMIVLIGIGILFTLNDFELSIDKLIEYIIGAAMALCITTVSQTSKKYLFFLLLFFSVLLILIGVFYKISVIAFIFKYMFLFFVFFEIFLDLNKKHYYLYDSNDKFVANIITE